MSTFTLGGPTDLSCDVLIVGSGAGGSSVATALLDAGLDVLMIEEGPYVSADLAPDGLSRSMPQMWRGGGLTVAFGAPPIAFGEGRCVGGGTEINSAIFQRAPESVIEEWRAGHRIDRFSAGDLAPYYDRAAAAVNASLTEGPLGPPTDILRRAGEAMGWKVTALERGHRLCAGTNLCGAGCPTGAKQSMTTSLLPKALAKGLRLVARCQVTKILRKGRQVTGVRAIATSADGRRHPVRIRCRDLFLCAGALQTPVLLQSSGMIRPGTPFQLHPTLRFLARFEEPVDAARHRLPLVAITEFMPELRFGGSILSLSAYGMALAEDWAGRSAMLGDYRHYAMYYAMIRPRGVGAIRALPFAREPLLTYKLTPGDWSGIIDGARKLSGALFAAGAQSVLPSVTGHHGWRGAAEARAWDPSAAERSRAALMSIHLFSSLPMGENPGICGVDSFCRLNGFDNVVVGDASVLPTAPGVNPQGSIMALAFRAADSFLARRAGAPV